MSEETAAPLDLNIDLNEVDTGRPILPKGPYVMAIGEMKKEENKRKDGFNLIVPFGLTAPTESTKGKPLNVGFALRNYYPLQPPSDKPDSTYWKEELARLQDAALGTEKGNRPPFNPAELIGQEVMVQVDIEETEEFGEQNRIKRVLRIDE